MVNIHISLIPPETNTSTQISSNQKALVTERKFQTVVKNFGMLNFA